MEQIFEHYGKAIITVIVLVALAAIIIVALKSDGYVAEAFQNMLEGFFDMMNGTTGTTPTPTPTPGT